MPYVLPPVHVDAHDVRFEDMDHTSDQMHWRDIPTRQRQHADWLATLNRQADQVRRGQELSFRDMAQDLAPAALYRMAQMGLAFAENTHALRTHRFVGMRFFKAALEQTDGAVYTPGLAAIAGRILAQPSQTWDEVNWDDELNGMCQAAEFKNQRRQAASQPV